jgi:putative glycosyltransferase (TIGR04372 family)
MDTQRSTRRSLVTYQISNSIRYLRGFLRRNFVEIRHINAASLHNKAKTLVRFHLRNLAEFSFLLPVTLLVSVVIRLMRPFLVIRYSSLNASRVGHLSLDPELATAEAECGVGTPNRPFLDIWYVWTGPFGVSNQFLLNMWKRSIRVGPRVLCYRIDQVSRLLPFGSAHVIPIRKAIPGTLDHQAGDIHGCLQKTAPHISFQAREINKCWNDLAEVGVDQNSRFVCLLVRDSRYQQTLDEVGFEGHNFRNSSIDSYVEAITALCNRKIHVFRMGAVRQDPLKIESPYFVDYSSNGMRTEMLDIFLSSRCQFFITTSTGLDGVARVFRRPHVKTNLSQIEGLQLSMPGLVILKQFFLTSENRYLNLSEIFERNLHKLIDGADLDKQGVVLHANSPSDIASVAMELDERMRGKWIKRDDEESLHEAFLMNCPAYFKEGPLLGRLGYHFMLNNTWLFK